ncbi:hypothetical protein DTO006G1_6774 [Penicillium roqueforti]|uniref:uncharacterized protein n=1 Tax=Penicillium roqueforti TaxID=5082 RepID=UPI00190C6C50|nr:uncharacterized protein LCP9604111_3222 [Penicillium roqueforti]KAF9250320.1 hypothetical protein LCP9604111_3222 [Penicillium roqueforti]KAI1830408.1 hypothetical protein CBS147337_8875 [Penicillium roqueforti]KAI2707505.1 hypothetical protein CBS147354_9514 [Penicillium roqueforti]KAI2758258.1 hypothetical protein DTO006G1_6774 [Penicillium roqueforti]KAI3096444.1 hypothetical protein CBS147333_9583 [Penicillium roqueforti]
MSTNVGDAALRGEEEYIRGHIFDGVDYERHIIGKGTLIMIIPPSASEEEPKTHRNVETEIKIPVPPRHEVKVLDALVMMTT